MLSLAGYIRVSRVSNRAGEGYISPDVQKEAILKYADDLGGEIVAWGNDQDYTGGNMERPGFDAILGQLDRGELDGLVVMKVDRFARSVVDGVSTVRRIIDQGQVFASCYERCDPKTPSGKFMLTQFFANAEYFLDQVKAGWEVSKARAVARGVHIGPTPIGYAAEKSMPLVPHPTYGPAMTSLFKRAAAGDSLASLARWMSAETPRKDGQPWQGSEVKRWIQSRVYLGEVHYGDLVNAEAHPPLTDPETFAKAQPGQSAPKRPNGRTFLLSGLVRCACCRYSMGGHANGGADGQTPVYRCGRKSARACPESSVIVASRLEDFVVGEVKRHVECLRLEAAEAGADLDELERELDEAEAELAAFASDLDARRRLGPDVWKSALDARADNRDAKKAARDVAFRRAGAVQAIGFDDLDHEGLCDLLRGMVRHVFVRKRPRGASVDDRTLIVWSDDPQSIDVPGPHRSAVFNPITW